MDLKIVSEKTGIARIFRITATPSKSSAGDWDSAVATAYDVTDQLVKSGGYEQELTYFLSSRDSDVMMSAHVNLTQDSFIDCMPPLSPSQKAMSYDDIVRQGIGLEGFLNDGRPVADLLVRGNLLGAWAAGRVKRSLVVRYTGKKQMLWVRADIRLLENPHTKDVELFFYLSDITKNELMSRMLERMSDVIYEFIAIITPADNAIRFIGSPLHQDMQCIDYDEYVESELRRRIAADSEELFREEYSIANIRKELAEDSHYSNIVAWRSDGGEPLRKMIQYFYLDPGKDLILCCITDVTEQYWQEQRRLQEVEAAPRGRCEPGQVRIRLEDQPRHPHSDWSRAEPDPVCRGGH